MRVEFSARADRQLDELYEWLAERAGQRIAVGYIERLLAYCYELRQAPGRGQPRPDIGPGIRALGFERAVGIQFKVRGDAVRILNVAYRGQDYEQYFASRFREGDPLP